MTSRTRCAFLVVGALAGGLFLRSAIAGPETTEKITDDQIARLIQQLGSRDFTTREEAALKLQEIDSALPALRAALQSTDSEVKQRAQTIIEVIEVRLEEVFIREAIARINDDGLDLFIDRMVLSKGYATEARWKATLELVRALSRSSAKVGAKHPAAIDLDFLKAPVANVNNAPAAALSRGLMDGSNGIQNADRKLIVSSKSLKGFNSTDHSILLVNGDIEILNSTTDSIIICNGSLKNCNYTKGCVIFCKGAINSMNCTEENAIFVLGELQRMNYTKGNVIEATELGRGNASEDNIFLNRKDGGKNYRAGTSDRFQEAKGSPFELFSFYDVGRAGLPVTVKDGAARVENVAEDKAFGRAGLRKGDRILIVDGEKFNSRDAFNQLVRRKIALGQETVFKVERDEQALEIKVRFGD